MQKLAHLHSFRNQSGQATQSTRAARTTRVPAVASPLVAASQRADELREPFPLRPVVAPSVLAVLVYGTVASLSFLLLSLTFRFPLVGTSGVPALAPWVPWCMLALHLGFAIWIWREQRAELRRREPGRLWGALAGSGLASSVLVGLQLLAFSLAELRVLG